MQQDWKGVQKQIDFKQCLTDAEKMAHDKRAECRLELSLSGKSYDETFDFCHGQFYSDLEQAATELGCPMPNM